MDETVKKILEIVTDMQNRMESLATKSDLEAVRKDLQKQIEEVQKEMRDTRKYAKEDIDMVLSRVSVLEKRVGTV